MTSAPTPQASSMPYRARCVELSEEIEEARRDNNLAALQKAQEELGKLLEHMQQDKPAPRFYFALYSPSSSMLGSSPFLIYFSTVGRET